MKSSEGKFLKILSVYKRRNVKYSSTFYYCNSVVVEIKYWYGSLYMLYTPFLFSLDKIAWLKPSIDMLNGTFNKVSIYSIESWTNHKWKLSNLYFYFNRTSVPVHQYRWSHRGTTERSTFCISILVGTRYQFSTGNPTEVRPNCRRGDANCGSCTPKVKYLSYVRCVCVYGEAT